MWAAEAWGSDAVTVLSWIAARTSTIAVGSAVLQIAARTPSLTAMTAVALNELSGGRFLLGLGVSGPQVVEGWHGVPYGRPLARTREYVSIVRRAVARREPLTYDGEYYQLPYRGPGATGLGKALKLLVHPHHEVPIYLAAIGPRNTALAAEIADGWLPFLYSPEKAPQVFGPHLAAGFAAAGDPTKAAGFEIVATVGAAVTDDLDAGRALLKPTLALYVGGMGPRGRNFYFDLACRYGYEEEATRIQDLYLDGKRTEAVAAVPDALVDELNLVGTRDMIRDRLAAWEASGVTTLAVSVTGADTLRTLAELVV